MLLRATHVAATTQHFIRSRHGKVHHRLTTRKLGSSEIRRIVSLKSIPSQLSIGLRFYSDDQNSSKSQNNQPKIDVLGYHQLIPDIGMGWWLVGTTAAVAGLVLTLELSQISEDYSNYVNTSEKKPHYEIIEVEDTASKLSFWERRLFDLMVIGRIGNLALLFTPLVILLPLTVIPFFRRRWWSLLRWTLQTAGGCWIKLGQWASTRPDLFPEELINTVQGLQDHNPSHSFLQTQEIIRKSFNAEIDQLFDDFSINPIASGAIAQVHKAKSKIDGQTVAVKILHPGIERLINLDLRIMSIGAQMINYLPTTEWMSLPEAIEEFSQRMICQADLRIEANNLKIFNNNFKGDPGVVFPRVIDNFTRKAVLVETFEVGVPLNDYLRTGALSASTTNKRLARLGLRSYLKMLLYDNFVHADLHPGNILVRKAADGTPQLVILDLGLVSHLSDADWTNFKDLFKCIVEGNGKKGADLMVTRARGNKLSPTEHDKFVFEMDVIFARVRQQKLAELNIGSFISEVMSTLRKYRVKIESNFATLCVATVVLEGIGRQLDPEINILDQSVPFLFWSGKTTLEDRIVYVKEKMKDELIEDDQFKVPDRTWPRRMWAFIKSVFQKD